MHRFPITDTLNEGEYQPFFLHTLRGFASRRTAFHRIYARELPPPPGAGEEAAGRAGWGDGGERSAGDGTKARYDLLIWNRCTSFPCRSPRLSSY
ncbi:protein of unknown function [Methanoculleus bourgensis]|uniref:Uncharacterized protein n=1 Tax=Methanoculleus bourgensis TaxID=83986 RepID=A0A0X3BLG6_9EURY|nr:protein of unknown function [Methanoculleus bourgensis]